MPPAIAPRLFLQSFRHWKFSWLWGDVVAGVSVAAIALPAQMATAHLAGMPPLTGIYAFIAAAIGFAILGANRYLSGGADSTIAPIFASGLSLMAVAGTPEYAHLAGLLSILVGLILITTYIFRLGWLADLLSYPVTIGFLAGISVHIIVGQLPQIFEIPTPHGHLLRQLAMVLWQLPHANLISTLIGFSLYLLTAMVGRRNPRLPAALLGLLLIMLLNAVFDLPKYGVTVLSAVDTQRPDFAFWSLPWQSVMHLFPLALLVALVCIMQTAAVARTTQDKEAPVSQDFAGIGLGCILSGIAGTFTTNASPARSVITQNSGGRSQLAALVAAGLLALIVLNARTILPLIPHAALAGVLMYVGQSILKISEIRRIFQQSREEFYLCIATLVMILLLRIEVGVMLGVILSLLHGVFVTARPNNAEFMRIKGTSIWWHQDNKHEMETLPNVLVYHFAAPLNFTNADFFSNQLWQRIAQKKGLRLLVIECSGILDIDLTAADKLKTLIGELHRQHITVCIARLEAMRAREALWQTGVMTVLPEDNVFYSVQNAIDARAPSAATTLNREI
ncbi:SulP family inorganic anion transporter [Plesiomonas shigelloides]|uniref:SulP family inorganic anion transporter n=1 Tax=Plesiomonas shigelloides TaxID=703 RepID=UPI00224738C8|nr:SulP family inorganic anion transporter [Plesiomonas shigelloides]MCX2498032.1 SulP family inorganic anion transporter [Plesiomonas shigelloides]